jgi:hypothetical protein
VVRVAYGGRPICERRSSVDIRTLRRRCSLYPGLSFSQDFTGSVGVETGLDAVTLVYSVQRPGTTEWKPARQRVAITWTACALGGRRPWFRCACGRRVAILYASRGLYKCRQCCGLAYASQSTSLRDRSLRRAQKIRMQLGGGPSVLDPFPEKPRGMHWRTYDRLRATAMIAEARFVAMMATHLGLSRR